LTPESPKLLLKPSNKIKQPLPTLELETKTDESNAIKQEEQKPIEEQQKSSEIMIASTPESPKLLLKPSNKIKQPLPMLELETKTDESNAIKQEEQKPIDEQKKSSEIMIASTPESPKLLLQSSNRIKKSLPKLDSESEIFLNSSIETTTSITN